MVANSPICCTRSPEHAYCEVGQVSYSYFRDARNRINRTIVTIRKCCGTIQCFEQFEFSLTPINLSKRPVFAVSVKPLFTVKTKQRLSDLSVSIPRSVTTKDRGTGIRARFRSDESVKGVWEQ